MNKLARPLVALASAALVALSLSSLASASAVGYGTAVVRTSADEFSPSYVPGYLAYTQNTLAKPKWFNTFVLPDGGSQFKVNPPRTIGFGGGMDATTGTTLAYQQVGRTGSDIALYDVATKSPMSAPAGLNTRWWEWGPSISANYILFNRNDINEAKRVWQKVILFDMNTHTSKTLAMVKSSNHLPRSRPGERQLRDLDPLHQGLQRLRVRHHGGNDDEDQQPEPDDGRAVLRRSHARRHRLLRAQHGRVRSQPGDSA